MINEPFTSEEIDLFKRWLDQFPVRPEIEAFNVFQEVIKPRNVFSLMTEIILLLSERDKALSDAAIAEQKLIDMEKRMEDARGETEHLKDTRQDPYDTIEVLQARLKIMDGMLASQAKVEMELAALRADMDVFRRVGMSFETDERGRRYINWRRLDIYPSPSEGGE